MPNRGGDGSYRVVVEAGGRWHKVCRIIYGRDGSYYVTSPYRQGEAAALMKTTVNYAKSSVQVALTEAIDTASIEDAQRAAKLSHHPDGLVQFSGPGITSGRDPQGQARGMAVESWPLDEPVAGPAFGLTLRGLDRFEAHDGREEVGDVMFAQSAIDPLPGAPLIYVLEGHYFPALWRRFVRTARDGAKTVEVLHPAGVVLSLRVLWPPDECDRQGFLGIELYTDFQDEDAPDPAHGFILSGSTGNLRRNDEGELLGDGVYCIAPREGFPVRRSLDYGKPSVPVVLPERNRMGAVGEAEER
jgi:hypothetical protein